MYDVDLILTPVACCSVIFGISRGADALPLGLDTGSLLLVFFWDGNFSLLVEKGLLGLIINIALIVFVMTR